jgi:hypothetical protein
MNGLRCHRRMRHPALVVAQAGSLPYRGLPIREPRETREALERTDAPPTASRRYGRLTICATHGARRIAPPRRFCEAQF